VLLKNESPIFKKQPLPVAVQNIFAAGKKIIGIAPFAQYAEKMYPLQKMKAVVQELAKEDKTPELYVLLMANAPTTPSNERDASPHWTSTRCSSHLPPT